MKSVWRSISIASFCVLLALPLIAQTKSVEDVEIRGYKKVSLSEIQNRILTTSGKEFSAEQAVKDFDRLMEIDTFDPMQCSLVIKDGFRGGKVVIFDLKEKP
ncbi:MAG: hypothetical protein ABI977_27220 [Acidobacteriota bacterium]